MLKVYSKDVFVLQYLVERYPVIVLSLKLKPIVNQILSQFLTDFYKNKRFSIRLIGSCPQAVSSGKFNSFQNDFEKIKYSSCIFPY